MKSASKTKVSTIRYIMEDYFSQEDIAGTSGSGSDIIFIGVHARRTDYGRHVKKYFHGHLVIKKYDEANYP